MKDPRRYIDRFCYRHPNFGIRNLMLYIVIANVAFWLVGAVNPVLLSYMSFDPAAVLRGQVWRVFTFMLYPPSDGLLAFIAFYFYYWIGSSLEREWGTPQFNVYFFSGVLLTVVYGFVFYFITGYSFSLDASYIYMSMFFSFAVLFPDMRVMLFFFLPIKIKWLAIVDAAFFLYGVLSLPTLGQKLIPIIAVLNFLIFCGGELFRARPRRASKNTVNFRREAQKIRYEQREKLYNHKCAVCGKTDTDYPNLEFRYCSRCAGYHCFCSEHINNHIHFTE